MSVIFLQELKKRILILDGAMGTMLQRANLKAEDFGGSEYEGCNELLNITRPELIQSIHETYLEAGADIIETNTFGGTCIVLSDYGVEDQDINLNIAGARLARTAVNKFSTEDKPRFVAGSIGPTNKMLSLTGGTSFDEMAKAYYRQVSGLIEGGVDLLLVETSQDTLNVKAAGVGILRAFKERGVELPIMISGTIEATGTTLAGQNIEAFYISLEHLKPITVGLNCATGPEFMRDHVRTLSQLAESGVSCYPNAGLPDENGQYLESPEEFAAKLKNFADEGWLNVVGGCCGTTPEHITALAKALKNSRPRNLSNHGFSAVSGIEPVFVEDENRPILVGERTNVIGSRKFRDLIANGSFDEASDIARAQTKKGAQVIDVCLANPDRDEYEDMEAFLPYVIKKVKAPLMIDSTDSKVIELGLKHSQGKSIINSVNLEEGSKRLEEVIPLLKQYGAALVVGTIDEKGMALTRERKLEVAKRSYEILVNQGIKPNDIIFDPLTFPVATGDEQYLGSAVETIEGISLIKKEFPEVKTILGISNVSFGLPQAGREVLNAVFLYHVTKAGLDYAIVNAEKLERYASISSEEKLLADKLLFETSEESISKFAEFYRNKVNIIKEKTTELNLEDRLSNYVVEGSKDGLKEDLTEALTRLKPLEIINGPLMTGMEEVGRLFNNNQLIVAEVLQSAEVMKAAVTFMEPYLEKNESTTKGKILLATVKGDVHDIGKNLLEIILSNNGYEVINLGIKVSPEQIIEAIRKENPNAIGLSGLLVKSAQQMVVTAQDLTSAGITVPLLVGGAALTQKFTDTKILPEYKGRVYYAKDAMHGLDIVNQVVLASKDTGDGSQGTVRAKEIPFKDTNKQYLQTIEGQSNRQVNEQFTGSNIDSKVQISIPTDLKRHLIIDYPLTELWPYVNLRMLLGRHLGLKGDVLKLLAQKDPKTTEIYESVSKVLLEVTEKKLIRANAVFKFFPAQAEGNNILIFDPNDTNKVLEKFEFPRQTQAPYLCLADYLRPKPAAGSSLGGINRVEGSLKSGEMDYIGMFAVTAGIGTRETANELKDKGEYLRSHIVQALSLELAEGFAEKLHQVMREMWGYPDTPQITMQDRFAGKYRGIRISLGYPACPNLEDQLKIFHLLNVEEIGIKLTEGYMMDPVASVSSMVFAHPEARYFSV